ncbi:MAG: methylmalonyl-CoA mutase family protein [Sandaracinaceae bacterium]
MAAELDLDRSFDRVSFSTWESRVREDLGGRPPDEALAPRLPEGFRPVPLATEADRPTASIGEPGVAPFVRGTRDEAGWRIVSELGGGEDLLARVRTAVAEGTDQLWLGPGACAGLEDRAAVSALLAAAEGTPTVLEGGGAGLGLVGAWATQDGPVELALDPIGALARTGALDGTLETAMGRLADVVAWSSAHRPDARPVLVSARAFHEAGAHGADELALGLATGLAYLRGLSAAGQAVDALPPRLRFSFGLDTDAFLEIAKLRAARLLWSKVLRAIGVDGPACGMWIHARSGERALTNLEPKMNLIRSTAVAFGAIAGGAQEVTVLPHDVLTHETSALAERLARTTQLMLRHESHLDWVLDPAGGSFYLERLTDDLARAAWAAFQEVEGAGGVVACLRDGWIERRLGASRQARAEALRTRRWIRVGVNQHGFGEPPAPEASPTSAGALPAGQGASPSDVPPAVEAARAGTPSGGLTEALRAWDAPASVHRRALAEPSVTRIEALPRVRDAEPFEAHRRAMAPLPAERRRAWVLPVGDAAALRPRVDFAREVMVTGGFEVDVRPVAPTAPEVTVDGAPATVVIAAADADLEAVVPGLVDALRAAGVVTVVVAARSLAGADLAVHRGRDVLALFGALRARLTGEVA